MVVETPSVCSALREDARIPAKKRPFHTTGGPHAVKPNANLCYKLHLSVTASWGDTKSHPEDAVIFLAHGCLTSHPYSRRDHAACHKDAHVLLFMLIQSRKSRSYETETKVVC